MLVEKNFNFSSKYKFAVAHKNLLKLNKRPHFFVTVTRSWPTFYFYGLICLAQREES